MFKKSTILLVALMSLFWLPWEVISKDYVDPLTQPLVKKEWMMVYVNIQAHEQETSAALMKQVIKCESGWTKDAIGDNGNSFGLSQIHLPSHTSVSIAQATDPKFAIEFMAKEFGNGNKSIWTCAR